MGPVRGGSSIPIYAALVNWTDQGIRTASSAIERADQALVALENARLLAEASGKAALEERQRLARELHDSVSQAQYGIAFGVKTASDDLSEGDHTQAAEPLNYVMSLAEAGLAEMRALIFELRPESLDKDSCPR